MTVRHLLLDRDGVLNRECSAPVASIDAWEWEEGALEALPLLGDAGVAVSVVTNQSAIGRGLVAASAVDGLHRWLVATMVEHGVHVVGIFVCPHLPGDGCACRKPEPGLVDRAVRASSIPRSASLLIGDDDRDLAAGLAAGVPSALVRTGKGAAPHPDRSGAAVFDDLLAVARHVVDGRRVAS